MLSQFAKPSRGVLALTCGLFLLTTALLYAGPLNPPPGPVTSTHKTLTEVEPRIAINATNTPGDADSLFKITQPGSYYLTGNITGVVGKHGIEIASSGVTLDLNGFDLVGVPDMGNFDGINASVLNIRTITVLNGSIRSWGDDGIDLGLSTTNNNRIEGLLVSSNAGNGINAGGSSIVINCAAHQNTGYGITTGTGCIVAHCVSSSNLIDGIAASGGATVSNCAAYNNAAIGINVATGSTVTDCTARINTLDGILCSSQCLIRSNTCSNNGNGSGGDGAGINATGGDNRIEGNNCTGADRGIDVDSIGNIIIRNTCSGNTNNWDVVAGNIILVVNATAAGPVTGNSGGAAPGSSDPNANFTY